MDSRKGSAGSHAQRLCKAEEQCDRPKDVVFDEIQSLLDANPVLQIQFFDSRVRQHLHALFGTGGRQRLKAALKMVHARTLHKTRQDVKNWPAYLVTLLKHYDPAQDSEVLESYGKAAEAAFEAKVKCSPFSSVSTTPEKTDCGNERESYEADSAQAEDASEEENKWMQEGKLVEEQADVDQLEGKLQEKQRIIDDLEGILQKTVQHLEEKQLEIARLHKETERLTSNLEAEFSQKVGGDLHVYVTDLVKRLGEKKAELDWRPTVDGERWQFQGHGSEWISFSDCANTELMGKFRAGQECCEIKILGATYVIDFNQGLQTNQRTGTTRAIRCCFNVPIHWKLTINEAFDFLTPGANFVQTVQKVTDLQMLLRLQAVLNQSRARDDGSECWCAHGSSQFEVWEAFQVKNLYVWRRYQRFVRTVHEKHIQHGIFPEECPPVSPALTNFAWDLQIDQANNERLLLHGTRDLETAEKIALEGFDNRVRGKSSLYGQGTYFAAQTCKSAQYATANGPRQRATEWMMGTMLFARVAVGHPFYATGPCRERARPPEKYGMRADSIIAMPGIPNGLPPGNGSAQGHMEIVTFDPAQAYPEFIVRYTER